MIIVLRNEHRVVENSHRHSQSWVECGTSPELVVSGLQASHELGSGSSESLEDVGQVPGIVVGVGRLPVL
jgi:hypothetical protein